MKGFPICGIWLNPNRLALSAVITTQGEVIAREIFDVDDMSSPAAREGDLIVVMSMAERHRTLEKEIDLRLQSTRHTPTGKQNQALTSTRDKMSLLSGLRRCQDNFHTGCTWELPLPRTNINLREILDDLHFSWPEGWQHLPQMGKGGPLSMITHPATVSYFFFYHEETRFPVIALKSYDDYVAEENLKTFWDFINALGLRHQSPEMQVLFNRA